MSIEIEQVFQRRKMDFTKMLSCNSNDYKNFLNESFLSALIVSLPVRYDHIKQTWHSIEINFLFEFEWSFVKLKVVLILIR